ncbi:MAG: hypothetical protein CVV44_10245 [Spirochaetae bacterium HGW-Spirochaetae-1]|jgi:diguanylate cyclase (GGDEF)-like protein/PAS domain S-box-containing protein|nr:MAG: hypothetical protein CVV44_10245 [Spirochaetae bacterium HGW-Spirochaetae-1]
MLKKPAAHQNLLAENRDLRARLEIAEQSLRDIMGGEADALLVPGAAGARLFILKGADQPYRTLVENMSEGAVIMTPEGLVLYSNRRFAGMMGSPLEKVIGSEIYNWFEPESRQVIKALLQDVISVTRREELALTAADGTPVPVFLSVSRMSPGEGPDSFCMVAMDLTEQKRNEAILADERLARSILEQAADAIVIYDGTGRIIRASRKAQEFSGRDLKGELFEQAFPLRLPDGTLFSSLGPIDQNLHQPIEAALHGDGQRFDFLVSLGHLKSARDELLGSVVTMTDITERKAREKQLSEALTIARIGYWEYEFSTDEFIFNDQYYLLHKITAEEAGGYRMSSADFASRYVCPEDASLIGQQIQLAFETRDPDYFSMTETRILTGKGEIVWVEVRLRVQKDLQGNTIRLIGVNQDVTDRKREELKLLESERKFTDLLGNVELLSVMRDREGRITYCNEYILRITGWKKEEVIGRYWAEHFLSPEIIDTKKKVYAELLLDGPGSRHLESGILTRSGERRLIRWNHTVLRSEYGKVIGTASIGEDITEQKKVEARITYLNRLYSLLSSINILIVHAQDRNGLFNEACKIAVEKGGFRMALLYIVDQRTKKIVTAASHGDNMDLLADIKNLLLSGDDVSNKNVVQAIANKKFVISKDSVKDPLVFAGKRYGEYGIFSMVALPLIVAGEAVGVLSLYAGEIEFFQKEEMSLLKELAGDIAFAIDHIEKKERLDYLAYYDEVTGLANRRLFLDRVAQHMLSAVAGNHKLAVFKIDLERFKNINDSLGWKNGDDLLKQVAEWLSLNIGGINLLARIDADHFAVVMPKVNLDNDTVHFIENTLATFSQHQFSMNKNVFRINAKVGIAIYPDDGSNAEILLRNAEAALKKAKSSGARYLFHTQKMTESLSHKLTLENQLRQAIDNEEFVLFYQPKINLANRKVASAEALIRWNKPDSGLIPPLEFIPILEETGLIHEVGRWALRKAVTDNLRWREAGLDVVRIAVNVSALQLRNIGFIDEIKEVIALGPHAASGLELEITESLIMEDVKRHIITLRDIRALGITIAIDDFGTGFSSLSYLARLPVDILKIDRSFIIDMVAGPEGLALVSTIINLAHSMNLKVVAEGVETEEQSKLLHLLRCEEMQGFLFSKPVPGEIFQTKFLVPR